MGHEVRQLVHQVDAQIIVVDAYVDVHPAHHQAACRPLHLIGQGKVLLARDLTCRLGERMSGRRDRGAPEPAGHLGDDGAQARKIGAGLGDGAAGTGARLELAAQEARIHLTATAARALLEERRRWILVDVARVEVDEQIFFFDADREWRLSAAHDDAPEGPKHIVPQPFPPLVPAAPAGTTTSAARSAPAWRGSTPAHSRYRSA